MNAMRHFRTLAVLALAGVASASCGDVARSGRSPVYLVIDSLGALAGGATTGTTVSVLQSDVLTKGSITSDTGTVILRTALKDVTNQLAPSTNNDVTIYRYHVAYKRADGRNTQGQDVPYAFDGAATGTIPVGGTLKFGFELVRHDAKMESPLAQLVSNPQIITTIADVTFYGRDLVGNEIQTTGSIQVDFGNFADPSN
jgi:hypothetical protein